MTKKVIFFLESFATFWTRKFLPGSCIYTKCGCILSACHLIGVHHHTRTVRWLSWLPRFRLSWFLRGLSWCRWVVGEPLRRVLRSCVRHHSYTAWFKQFRFYHCRCAMRNTLWRRKTEKPLVIITTQTFFQMLVNGELITIGVLTNNLFISFLILNKKDAQLTQVEVFRSLWHRVSLNMTWEGYEHWHKTYLLSIFHLFFIR